MRDNNKMLTEYAKRAKDEGLTYGQLQAREYASHHPINKEYSCTRNYISDHITSHSRCLSKFNKATEEQTVGAL